ncbi:MAG: 4Fe-4S double cluster binding domain-containing protein [Betaproteobacteria bacterium]
MYLREWAESRGFKVGWGPISLLDDVGRDLASRHEAGEFDEAFFREVMTSFTYQNELDWAWVRTVGVIVVPRPAHLLTFVLRGQPVEVVLPPTYLHYRRTTKETIAALNDEVAKGESHFVPLPAPLKALAARLGLVWYGKNNITYTARTGSYHQLVGFASDLDLGPPAQPSPAVPAALPRCASCSACQQACPTNAIGADRFLLRAERCLTFLNESGDPWPSWLPPTAHNCLLGCLACQRACPQNAGRLRLERIASEFSADETAALLAGQEERDGRVWERLTEKLTSLGLEGYASLLGRNLRALLPRLKLGQAALTPAEGAAGGLGR